MSDDVPLLEELIRPHYLFNGQPSGRPQNSLGWPPEGAIIPSVPDQLPSLSDNVVPQGRVSPNKYKDADRVKYLYRPKKQGVSNSPQKSANSSSNSPQKSTNSSSNCPQKSANSSSSNPQKSANSSSNSPQKSLGVTSGNTSDVGIGTVNEALPLGSLLTIKRAGIVAIRIDGEENLHAMLAKDKLSGDDTDLGGHPEPTDQDCLDTAIREFGEESLGVFGPITREQVGRSIAVFNAQVLIVFVRLDYDPKQIIRLFDQRAKAATHPIEVTKLFEVDRSTLLSMIMNHGRLYERIRILLRDVIMKHGNFL